MCGDFGQMLCCNVCPKKFFKNFEKSLDKWRKKEYTIKRCETRHAPLAQLVEHLTLNQGVHGSSP